MDLYILFIGLSFGEILLVGFSARGVSFSACLWRWVILTLPYSMVINKVLDLNASVPLIPLGRDFTLMELDYILDLA